jgi:hypothetical protein
VEGVVTAPGKFHGELTRVDFDRLWMQRGDESLPRVLNLTTGTNRNLFLKNGAIVSRET